MSELHRSTGSGHPPSGDPHPVVYTIRVDGTVDIRFEGMTGRGLLFLALGVAAQASYMHTRDVLVLENGLPYRWVAVTLP